MLIKKINYVDYNDEPRTFTAYFNLNETELAKYVAGFGDKKTVAQVFQDIIDANDRKGLLDFVTELVHLAYGKKSPDGSTLDKSDEAWKAFYYSEAYNQFVMELMGSERGHLEFLIGVLPKKLQANVRAAMAEAASELTDVPGATTTTPEIMPEKVTVTTSNNVLPVTFG